MTTPETINSDQMNAPVTRNVPKRPRPADDWPEKGVITHLSGDICKHCYKQCTETGEQGQAIQYDFCGVWVYVVCDGISKDHYQGLVSLTSSIENLAYLC